MSWERVSVPTVSECLSNGDNLLIYSWQASPCNPVGFYPWLWEAIDRRVDYIWQVVCLVRCIRQETPVNMLHVSTGREWVGSSRTRLYTLELGLATTLFGRRVTCRWAIDGWWTEVNSQSVPRGGGYIYSFAHVSDTTAIGSHNPGYGGWDFSSIIKIRTEWGTGDVDYQND